MVDTEKLQWGKSEPHVKQKRYQRRSAEAVQVRVLPWLQMNKKLLTYFREGKYWICYSQKLRITGYGKSKQDAYELFMFAWNYIRYEHKNKNKRHNIWDYTPVE